jgi:hypothetical protein
VGTCRGWQLSRFPSYGFQPNRSPWSNKYDPPIEDGFQPSEKLRNMESEFNELFDAYREMYFEGGTSSVYLWDQDQGFAGCYLIKKSKCAYPDLGGDLLAECNMSVVVKTATCTN